MSERIAATSPDELPAVVRVVHDCWFDKDEIQFDPRSSTLRIRFIKPLPEKGREVGKLGPLRTMEVPYFESFLHIFHIRTWHVDDTQEVGTYDFNEIRYEPQCKRINITTGVPLSIMVDVERLEVTVEVTDTVADVRKHRMLL